MTEGQVSTLDAIRYRFKGADDADPIVRVACDELACLAAQPLADAVDAAAGTPYETALIGVVCQMIHAFRTEIVSAVRNVRLTKPDLQVDRALEAEIRARVRNSAIAWVATIPRVTRDVRDVVDETERQHIHDR